MEKLENKITIILNNYKENERLIKELLINKKKIILWYLIIHNVYVLSKIV